MGYKTVKGVVVLLLLLTSLTSTILHVMAQDEKPSEPNITDPEGDSAHGDRDIVACWFGGETSTSFNAVMELKTLPFTSIDNADIFIYEIYFSFGEKNFAATCTVYFLFQTQIGLGFQYNIYEVNYTNAEDILNPDESNPIRTSGTVSVSQHTISIYINKDLLGKVNKGDQIDHVWAAVRNTGTPRAPKNIIEDSAKTYNEPGLPYTFQYQNFENYDFTMTAIPQSQNVTPGIKANYDISITSNATVDMNLTITWSTTAKGWNLSFAANATATYLNITLVRGTTYVVKIGIIPPRDAENGTEAAFTIKAVYNESNKSVEKTVAITATVVFYPPINQNNEEKSVWGRILDWVRDHKLITAIIFFSLAFIVVVVVLVIIFTSEPKPKKGPAQVKTADQSQIPHSTAAPAPSGSGRAYPKADGSQMQPQSEGEFRMTAPSVPSAGSTTTSTPVPNTGSGNKPKYPVPKVSVPSQQSNPNSAQ
ncbi:MAG: hypothetical protein QW728_03720 [Thermoplasmata archaeon]